MKITIEWTVEELKEFWITDNVTAPKQGGITGIVVNTNDWITTEWDWITFRYKWKERSLYKENEKKSDWDEYFTFDGAVEYCKNLDDRHLPSIEEWQELLKARCEWKGYKMDWDAVYSYNNDWLDIWDMFSIAFNLPFAGYREDGDATVSGQGIDGRYWTSSPNGVGARYLRFVPSCAYFNLAFRAFARPVRCFKNSYGPQTLISWNQTEE